MNAEHVDLDTWCFWFNASLNPLGYSARVTPTDAWFYTAPEVIRVDDAPPICPGTIWAGNKESEMHITYDWSICHGEHR